VKPTSVVHAAAADGATVNPREAARRFKAAMLSARPLRSSRVADSRRRAVRLKILAIILEATVIGRLSSLMWVAGLGYYLGCWCAAKCRRMRSLDMASPVCCLRLV
jgi:hypothetical protein